jgi:hypothetical protein
MIITLRSYTVLKALAQHPAGATAETLLADLGAESTDQRSAKAGILRTLMAMEEKGLARWEMGAPTEPAQGASGTYPATLSGVLALSRSALGRFTITPAGQAQIAQPYCMPHHQQKSRARAGAS